MTNNSYKQMLSLSGKNIVVTGGCGLIGKEICRAVGDFDGNVIVADIDSTTGESFAEGLSANGKKAVYRQLDINSEVSCTAFINSVCNEFGCIHGLVNNAYPRNKSYGKIYEDVDFQSWRENIDIHLNGYFNITHKISRVMQNQKEGNIINMCSIYGLVGPDFSIYEGTKMTNPVEYAAIKGGLINLTRYLASYLGKDNIRVNSISPGGILDKQDENFIGKYISRTPLGRMGEPEDIAGGVVYLLSDLSSFVTGHNLIIDGGWTIK